MKLAGPIEGKNRIDFRFLIYFIKTFIGFKVRTSVQFDDKMMSDARGWKSTGLYRAPA